MFCNYILIEIVLQERLSNIEFPFLCLQELVIPSNYELAGFTEARNRIPINSSQQI